MWTAHCKNKNQLQQIFEFSQIVVLSLYNKKLWKLKKKKNFLYFDLYLIFIPHFGQLLLF